MTPPSQREARPRLRARRGDEGIAPYEITVSLRVNIKRADRVVLPYG